MAIKKKLLIKELLCLMVIGLLLSGIFGCYETGTGCGSSDIEQIDSCLIGKTIEECIQQLKVTPASFIPHVIFYRELHGIYIRFADTKITLIIDGYYNMNNEEAEGVFKEMYKHILKKRVKGLCWSKQKTLKYRKVGNVSYAGCMSI
jgi:hypothetical protein